MLACDYPRAVFLNHGSLNTCGIQLPEFSRQYVAEGVLKGWLGIGVKLIRVLLAFPSTLTGFGERIPPTNRL